MTSHLRLWFLLAFFSVSLAIAQDPLDSLKQAAGLHKGAAQVAEFQEIAYQSLFLSPDSALPYSRKSLALAVAQNLDSLEAEAFIMIGFAHFVQGNNDSAAHAYGKAAALHEQRGDRARQAAALSNLASTYNRAGRMEAALEVTLQSLDLFQQTGDSLRLGLLLGNAGNLYQNLRRLEEAKAIIRRSGRVLEALGQIKFVGNVHNMLGLVYSDQDSLGLAKSNYLRALALYAQEDDPANRSGAYNNLGFVYQLEEKLDSALHYFRLAYELSSELGSTPKKLTNSANVAEMYLYLGLQVEAGRWLDSAAVFAAQTREPAPLATYYKILGLYHGIRGELAESYQASRLSDRYRDSIFNADMQQAVAEMQVRYETERKDRELAEASLALEIRERQSQRMLLGGLVLLAFLLLGFLLWWYRSRLEQREAIHQERLRQQDIRLETTIQTQEEERSRLARDLHDGIGQLLSATRLHFGAFSSSVEPPGYQKALEMLDDACREVREVAHIMMPRSLEEDGLAHALEEMLSKTLGATAIHYQFELVGKMDRLNRKYEINMYRIAQELIQNILKHAMASEVHVQLVARSDKLLLVVEDNGKGFPAGQDREGMGMVNIAARAKTIDAVFHIDRGPQGGTIATLRVAL